MQIRLYVLLLFAANAVLTEVQMVLDAGRLVEFDAPRVLLEKEDGYLKALVDESGDREALYSMAYGNSG